jgi:hypothetical protein
MYGAFLAFLIDPTFWSRIGFLISYIATSLIALEVVRLVYTDANKRDVEKWLEAYSKQRTESPRRRRVDDGNEKTISVSIQALERSFSPAREQPVDSEKIEVRSVRAAATPESEKPRRRAPSSSSHAITSKHDRTSSPTPLRKLRKRSDTLTSTGSSESRRRHREASPASEAGSSRQRTRSREEREKRVGLGLGKLMRGKV